MGPELIPELLATAADLLRAVPGISGLSDSFLSFDITDAGPFLPPLVGGGIGAGGAGNGPGGPPGDPPPDDDEEEEADQCEQ